MTGGIAFRAFGWPALTIDGLDAAMRLRRGLAALAWLLEAGRPMPRAMLAELLWPEEADGIALERLRRLIHRLNDAASARLILPEGRASLSVTRELAASYDVGQFRAAAMAALETGTAEDLETASALVGAPFLDGIPLDDCPDLDNWAAQTRLELESLILRVLRRRAERLAEAGEAEAAILAANALVARDPHRESSHRLVLRLMLDAGDPDAARAHFRGLEDRLRTELGVAPSATTRALLDPAPTPPSTLPLVRYAQGAGGAVAYAVIGREGPALVIAPGFVSHIEMAWEDPALRDMIGRLAQGRRVVVFDRRGQGLSERMGVRQAIDEAARDMLSIIEAEGFDRVSIFGSSEGGPSALRLAHARPELVERLILFGTLAKGVRTPDFPHAMTRAQFDQWRAGLVSEWGGPASLEAFAPSRAADPAFRAWWARLLRQAATPVSVAATLAAFRDMDVRHLLPEIRTPALVLHRNGDRAVRIAAGRALAEALPDASFVELGGDDHWWWCGDADAVLSEIEAFLV